MRQTHSLYMYYKNQLKAPPTYEFEWQRFNWQRVTEDLLSLQAVFIWITSRFTCSKVSQMGKAVY